MTATLIGATGLIGGYLLDELLKSDHFDRVKILIRRPFHLSHPKLEKKLVDFSDQESYRLALEESDVIFCTIGTTQKKVKGDKSAYRKVDYDITVNAARLCKLTGCETFVFVSSVGANSKSNNFYLKLKGEIEEAVKDIGPPIVYAMRPSVLLGNRKEFRLGEKIGKYIMKIFSFLLPARYKPIQGKEVANSMLAASQKKEKGFFVCGYKEIKNLIN
jgi:uncharacterized protein YbjT (DUF2867 family)